MKLAIVHPSFAIKGGAENLMVWMARGLAGKGHCVTLFTTDYNPELWSGESNEKFEIRLLRTGVLSRLINSKRVTIRDYGGQLSRLLADYEVIFCSIFPSHLWVVQARKYKGSFNGHIVWYLQEPSRKFYWKFTERHLIDQHKYCELVDFNAHLREDLEKYYRGTNWRKARRQFSWDRKAVNKMDLVLANSQFSAENISRAFEAPTQVCYPGIPTYRSAGEKILGEFLLAVSPLRTKKNVHNIIEALHIISEKRARRDIQLKIVGQGPCRAELEALVCKRNLSTQVEFLGFLTDQELRETYRKARLSIYIPIDEPFGLIAVESMYHGVPPIVSDHGGLSEIVVHGETGFTVNPFDPRKVADALVSIWDDGERIEAMGQAGRRRVEEHFTLERFLNRIEDLLINVCKE